MNTRAIVQAFIALDRGISVLYATFTSTFMLVGFVSRLHQEMGPKLKRKLIHAGVCLPFGVEKGRAGSLPRFSEMYTSRLKINGKGWFSTSFVEQETSPFNQSI